MPPTVPSFFTQALSHRDLVTSCPPDDLESLVGRFIGHTFNGGYIALSLFVSFAGSWTAVELLHRRTGSCGTYNWFLLIGAATAMGAVAIWCMHYIGNRAFIMCQGDPRLIILYSAGYTAGSFFLAIIAVCVAFYFCTITESMNAPTTLIGGLLMGGAICGMHYLGQVGITNYAASYETGYVIGAAIISVAASTIALTIFFFYKSRWTNMWWKRIACAVLLATGVSGMHWCATVGTEYQLESVVRSRGLSPDRVINMVTVLSVCACLALVALSFIGQRSRRRTAQRAKQITLAAVVFDTDGKLMVNSEGLLPCRKITNAFLEKSFSESFDVDHPIFSWLFRVSHCWETVGDLVPRIREHLRTIEDINNFGDAALSISPHTCRHCREDYESLFKSHFCVAASDLATTIQQPIENLGILFDEILSTGIRPARQSVVSQLFRSPKTGEKDLESSSLGSDQVFGRGQLLFTVRKVSEQEASHLTGSGFVFTPQSYVIDHLASKTQAVHHDIQTCLRRMNDCASHSMLLDGGVHLGCFALRPLANRGFDVLVRRSARNLLPSTPILSTPLEPRHLHILNQLDGMLLTTCRHRLRHRSESGEESNFAFKLLEGIERLSTLVDNEYLDEARLSAQPLEVPSSSPTGATFIAFRVMTNAHDLTKGSELYEFSPLKFFITRQRTYKGSPNIEAFSRRIQYEILHEEEGNTHSERKTSNASTLNSSLRVQHPSAQSQYSRGGPREPPKPARLPSYSDMHGNVQDKRSIVRYAAPSCSIHNTSLATRRLSADDLELRRLWEKPEMLNNHGADFAEKETFVEKLIALTIDERKQKR